jgi:hypothetical protein
MTPGDDPGIQRHRREMLDLARAMLRGDIGILAGSQRMLVHRSGAGLDESDGDMLTFVAIESREDHLPIDPGARAHLDAAALARADAEIAEAEAYHRPAALAACESLLRRFAPERETATPSEPDESG